MTEECLAVAAQFTHVATAVATAIAVSTIPPAALIVLTDGAYCELIIV